MNKEESMDNENFIEKSNKDNPYPEKEQQSESNDYYEENES